MPSQHQWRRRSWYRWYRAIAIPGVIATVVILAVVGGRSPSLRQSVVHKRLATPTALISRNVPAYSNNACYPARNANDSSYETVWSACNSTNGRAMSPVSWLAYDLSSVPAARRATVILAWYANCCSYDNTISGTGAYNLPGGYTIDANSARGGTRSAPASGWRTLVTVTTNPYHSRQHVLHLSGYTWVRINISASDGSPGNYGVQINMDVFNPAEIADDWIFYGDSITEAAMGHTTAAGGFQYVGDMVQSAIPGIFPLAENGGIGYQTASSAQSFIPPQLALFPGKYVGLAYGTNDANGGCGSSACLRQFYDAYAHLVQDVLRVHKIPVVPTIPWGCTASLRANAALYNREIEALYRAYPQVAKGPDFYTYFKDRQTLISADCIHPNDAAAEPGMGEYRRLWANTMIGVYKSTSR